jgi:pimeloyl-ACP methyl ester carboxylesterase
VVAPGPASGDDLGMSAIERWWSQGERVRVQLGGAPRSIFLRRAGAGPPLTLLHGFPSSSYDWARVLPELAAERALLLFDFLGFGASDKPADHDYSIAEQADLVEAVWEREGVAATAIVAHDYAVSVTQELLARRDEGALAVDLTAVHLLNGGLYPDVYRPQPGQLALLDPEQGPMIGAQITEQLWTAVLAPTFAEGFDASQDSADIWASMRRDDGHRIVHRLIQYMRDREANAARWVGALEGAEVPLSFVWGMLAPISGAHMAQRIRERLPAAPLAALEDVCHWPALEAPERVVEAVLAG